MVEDLGDKVSESEKSSIEAAVTDLEEATKSDDKDQIQAKLDALSKVAEPVVQRMYQDASAQGPEAPGPDPSSDGGPSERQEDAMDAEFEEVKDDDKEK